MFGAQYFGQEDFAGVVVEITTDSDGAAIVPPTGGGGWAHRGPVDLPQRTPPKFKTPKFKKITPYRW